MHRVKKTLKRYLRPFDRHVAKGRLFLLCNGVTGERYRTIQRMNRNPIFIGGCGRSGTTLLLSLLSCHPHIFAVGRTGAFCHTAYFETDDPEVKFKMERLHCYLKKEEVPLEEHDRWCEKTPKNVHFAREILDFFGKEARFLNIVRDGRDVVVSNHPSDPDTSWVTPERWVRDVSAGLDLKEEPRAMTLRYEDLVRNHMDVLRRVCEFLDEPFVAEAFRAYPDTSQIQNSENWFTGAREVSDESVGRWRRAGPSEAVERLLSIDEARFLLRYYGYMDAPSTGSDESTRAASSVASPANTALQTE